MSEQSWAPAEQQVPDLLEDLMHMGVCPQNGRVIQLYKHRDTRRYINLDSTGQAWQLNVDPLTGDVGARRIELADAKAWVLS